jgi:hypothetical protein
VHIWECKTHSAKSFNDLEAKGLYTSKPMHWAQCQSYMHGTHKKDFAGPRLVKRALYTAVCKDDDRIYTERIKYDKDSAERLEQRSHEIVSSPDLPFGVSQDPTWYQCKMCDGWDICHGAKLSREVNCRTCAHSTPEPDSTWSCARFGGHMPIEWTREAHKCHVMHPGLTPYEYEVRGDGVVFDTEVGPVGDSLQLVQLRVKEGA